jgi:hypothetical protein
MRNFAITAITAIGIATAAATLAYTAEGGHGGSVAGGYALGGSGQGAPSSAVSRTIAQAGGSSTTPGSTVSYADPLQPDLALWTRVHGHAVWMDDAYSSGEFPSDKTAQR